MEIEGELPERLGVLKTNTGLRAALGWMRIVLVVVMGLAGLALFAGGVWLAVLGGTFYYWLAGLGLIVDAVMICRRSAWSYGLFAGLILATLIWAISEVGLDLWQLVPRLDLIAALGAFLILLQGPRQVNLSKNRALSKWGYAALVILLVASGIVAIMASVQHPHELAGSLPKAELGDLGVAAAGEDWRAYGGTNAGTHFSNLTQITPQNVSQLRPAWIFHTGDMRKRGDPAETTFEVTPLKIDGTLYLCTPHDLVFALDAETGKIKWQYDPRIRETPFQSTQHLTCRGVAYADFHAEAGRPSTPSASDCDRKIFLPTVDGRLIALNAETGKVCSGFGEAGSIDLWRNMPNVTPGSYYSTSPPLITKDLVIVGGAVNDNVSVHETSGVIRAFNLQTGSLVWNWDSRNPNKTRPIASDETFSENSPNSWGVSSYDPALGLIFVPMGNQPPDEFGGNRDVNVEKYSSSVVALDAESGAVVWVFQGTHHDLWDMDIPAQPSLLELAVNGEHIPAVVIVTKQGEIFVLDRRTGKPVLPVAETAAPQDGAEGDRISPTQPSSALSFNPPALTERAMWGLSPLDQLACRIKFRKLRYQGRYTPPSERGSITYPGGFGVFNWGGMAIDPERKVAFGMPVHLAFVSTLIPRQNSNRRLVTGAADPPFNENFGSPYAVKIAPFVSPLHIPCQAPPWGFVAGADLQTGKISYRHVNGTVRDLSRIPLPLKLGVPGIGGPIITKGGLAFLSGTLDNFVRAYDVTTGMQLWEHRLPAGGQATPMTYWSKDSQRQFVVVVAGGHGGLGTKAGDSVIAYALPRR